MIYFSFSAASPTLVTTLCVLLLLLLLSSFLNPAVFLYNRKKSSVAGLLYTILSATDFIFPLLLSGMIFYHASTIRVEDLECAGREGSKVEPQNCLMQPARTTSILFTVLTTLLNTTVFLTTAMLAVVRSIQILRPFYQVRKWRVFAALLILVAAQTAVHAIHVVPLAAGDETFFIPTMMLSLNDLDPLNLNFKTSGQHQISTVLQNSILTLMQLAAVFSCGVTAIFLIRKKSHGLDEGRLRRKTRDRKEFMSAVKVMMTNLMSFLLVLLLGTPLFSLVVQAHSEDVGYVSENIGWIQFWVVNIFPMTSSVWNPAVFLSLTPKSRSSILALTRACAQRNA